MSATQNSSSIISSMYKSRKTLLSLMKKQGYQTEEYENFSITEVNAMYTNSQLDMLLEKKEKKTIKMPVSIESSKYFRKSIGEVTINNIGQLKALIGSISTNQIAERSAIHGEISNLVMPIFLIIR